MALSSSAFHRRSQGEARTKNARSDTGNKCGVGGACTLHSGVIILYNFSLPGSKGAQPYHQARNRGVKLVGLIAHYVNNDLEDELMIEQIGKPVDHTSNLEDIV